MQGVYCTLILGYFPMKNIGKHEVLIEVIILFKY